jgi:hypothetical protein
MKKKISLPNPFEEVTNVGGEQTTGEALVHLVVDLYRFI